MQKEKNEPWRIGIDIHGVADTIPEFLSALSTVVTTATWEVHVITGNLLTEKFIGEIHDTGLVYTHIFSVAGSLISKGHEPIWKGKDNPWFDDELWDMEKGLYCKDKRIHFHLDDTKRYAKYYDTPFALLMVDGK